MLFQFERVGSTMDVVHQLAATGATAGTVVVAREQLQGRGSRGRPWHSPRGGLWLSVLLRPAGAGRTVRRDGGVLGVVRVREEVCK